MSIQYPREIPQIKIIGPSIPDNALCYLATPYSKYEGGNLELAFRDAARLAARVMQTGIRVYSPIAHTHPLAIYGDVDPLDHDIWLPFDEAMMLRSDILIVATMKGWKESKGVQHEIAFFTERKKPVHFLDPVTMELRKAFGTASRTPAEVPA